jgi:hypothetical protein
MLLNSTLNSRMTVNEELGSMWMEAHMISFKEQEALWNTTKNLIQES